MKPEILKTVIVIPTAAEYDLFLNSLHLGGIKLNPFQLERIQGVEMAGRDCFIFTGGLGKTQFAVSSQYLIDQIPGSKNLICLGAGGSLSPGLSPGHIVVGNKSVEHDYKKNGGSTVPAIKANAQLLKKIKKRIEQSSLEGIHFGAIASGDEDILDEERKEELARQTGCIAVAWEGIGGAKACRFSNVPYVEIRGITDNADSRGIEDFHRHLKALMTRLAEFTLMFISG